MEQHFYVLFDPDRFGFYRDCHWKITEDVLMAERFYSLEEAKKEIEVLSKNFWIIMKVIITVENID